VFFLADRVLQNAQRLVERVDHGVAIARLEALLDALWVNVNAEKRRAVHGGRERLGSTHPPHAPADDQLAAEVAAEMLFACCREGLERSLHNSLRSDVDPRTSSHLAVHHQASALEFVKLLPVGPVA